MPVPSVRLRRAAARLALGALALLALPLLPGGALRGQDAAAPARAPMPRRPTLGAEADTNDALQYFLLGQRLIDRDPEQADRAFHWATRLDPRLSEALYGRYVAMLLARAPRLPDYWRGSDRVVESAEFRRIDSLLYRATTLNPLLDRRQDGDLLRAVVLQAALQSARRAGVATGGGENDAELRYYLDQALGQADPGVRALISLSDGYVVRAQEIYRDMLKRAKKEDRAWVHVSLARTWVRLQQPDSAIAEFTVALGDLRQRDVKSTVRWYEPKALHEHSIGLLHERAGRDSAAREAYQRALSEDLSYYPAHAQLAMLALGRGDTTTAISELETAVQIRGDDAVLRFQLAQALLQASRVADAVPHLERAVALEPWYAAPYALLGRLNEAYEMRYEAAQYYKAFLARASRRDPERDAIAARLAALGDVGPPPPATTAPPAPDAPR